MLKPSKRESISTIRSAIQGRTCISLVQFADDLTLLSYMPNWKVPPYTWAPLDFRSGDGNQRISDKKEVSIRLLQKSYTALNSYFKQ